MKKITGKVTEQEKSEILTLFERQNGLKELAQIVTADNDLLYNKLVKDMGETSMSLQKWWDSMYMKYQWEGDENASWEINFETNEIYLTYK